MIFIFKIVFQSKGNDPRMCVFSYIIAVLDRDYLDFTLCSYVPFVYNKVTACLNSITCCICSLFYRNLIHFGTKLD